MRCVLGLREDVVRHAARLLLLALSVAALGPVVHGVHEDSCDPFVLVHDARHHHVQSAQPLDEDAAGTEHCVACHFARSSRGLASWERTGRVPLDGGPLIPEASGPLAPAPSSAPLPARAPPSLS